MLEVLLSQSVLPWILIAAGVIFLIIEAASPGFFLGVPGTALVVLGVFSFFAYDLLFTTPIGIIVAVVAAVIAVGITIIVYRKISPDRKPSTISKDTIKGKKGLVTAEISPDSISGKVEIDGAVWSAKSTGGIIPAGVYVTVVESRGVHVIVEEVK
ncbi:MAG TPA: NfeD family protein [Methanocorpusculum sp.]|nr:NfeD family protein [Candidatus Methanocorpusculum equi]MCQ2357737.1 NfeD family protein [Methanocorpusculum sp.]HJJ33134.1 NfeD family protein [Methanocorpusculum sp.]HJJ44578.1 NfeD family protein [Methanocorpusculum sp.]HJJ58603.1 NfeD family protein [Methanocorpusculum sp.]